jgi:hypothetical protein
MRRVPLLLVLLAGCTSTPRDETKPEPPFTLAFDAQGPVELLNGAGREFAVRVRRAEGFNSPVTLRAEVSPADNGVSVQVEEKSTKAIVNVSETARPGDYVVRVTGKGAEDAEASVELRVRVPPKD